MAVREFEAWSSDTRKNHEVNTSQAREDEKEIGGGVLSSLSSQPAQIPR